MILIENTEVVGFGPSIRGMRNPKNSWAKSDSEFEYNEIGGPCVDFNIGEKDQELMATLAHGGPAHAKYRRMINVYVDITAPLYWWKEFDTYKVGTVANSCSTMHKIQAKEFVLDNFSHEHLIHMNNIDWSGYDVKCSTSISTGVYNLEKDDTYKLPIMPLELLKITVKALNNCREAFLETDDKKYWWQMIQLLPSSYNQKRTIMLNYEVLTGMYKSRNGHKLNEWQNLCSWIETLPLSELIINNQ